MDYAGFYPPLSASGWHRAGGGRRADRTGTARFREGVGASLALEGRARRQAHRDALETLRAVGGRRVQCDGRGIQGGDRHRDERIQRGLRGRAAEGFRLREHWLGPRSSLGPAYDAAVVPDQSAEDERRRRLSRQEVWRMDRRCRKDLQAGQRLAPNSRRDGWRLYDLPQVGNGQGRLQRVPQGPPGLP